MSAEICISYLRSKMYHRLFLCKEVTDNGPIWIWTYAQLTTMGHDHPRPVLSWTCKVLDRHSNGCHRIRHNPFSVLAWAISNFFHPRYIGKHISQFSIVSRLLFFIHAWLLLIEPITTGVHPSTSVTINRKFICAFVCHFRKLKRLFPWNFWINSQWSLSRYISFNCDLPISR